MCSNDDQDIDEPDDLPEVDEPAGGAEGVDDPAAPDPNIPATHFE